MDEQTFNALPPAQRKAHQERLQEKNLYTGDIDGKWGAGTKAAFQGEVKLRKEEAETARRGKIEESTAEADNEVKKAEAAKKIAEAEAATAATARKKRYAEQESSGLGMTTKSSASILSPALATALGYKVGGALNERLDRGQEKRNVTLRGAADDRVRGLTTREGAVKGTKLAGAMPFNSPAMRSVARMSPHLGLGGLAIGKGATLMADVDEDQEFYPRMADRAAGMGYLGFGSGLLKRGMEHASSPGVSPDAQALSVINSSQLRRNHPGAQGRPMGGQTIEGEVVPNAPQRAAVPPPASPKAPEPGTKAHMMQQAKDLKIPGRFSMNKAQLADAISGAMKQHGGQRTVGKRLPKLPGPAGTAAAIASGAAYALSPDSAEAADGSTMVGQAEALTNAAGAGGVAYGASKLAQAVPAISRAMGPLGAALSAHDYGSQAQDIRGALPEGIAGDIGAQVAPLAMRGAQDIEAIRNLPAQAQEFVARNQSDPMSGMADEIQGRPPQAQAQRGAPPGMAQVPERNLVGRLHPTTQRPFIPGRHGGVATEESVTVTHPKLNQGQPTNIPSIWGGQRPPVQEGQPGFEDWAVEQALKSGQQFEAYPDIPTAVEAAKARSNQLGQEMQQGTLPRPQSTAPQASPYPQKLTQKIQRMVKGGASPDQIAKFLNQAAP